MFIAETDKLKNFKGMIVESDVIKETVDNTNADISKINKALIEYWK